MSEHAGHADLILRAAIAAADPAPAVLTAVRNADLLHGARRVHLLSIGKAARAMAHAAFAALHRAADSALVIVPHDLHGAVNAHDAPAAHASGVSAPRQPDPSQLTLLHAGHPIPDASSSHAAARIEEQLAAAATGDVLLVLLSGGASSLCAAPAGDISVNEYADLVRTLMHAGADIAELNTVRAHIDRLKGGGMARLIAPAQAIGLIVSDVVGNRLDIIASGPLTACTATAADAVRVLEKHGVWSGIPLSVRRVLSSDDTGGDCVSSAYGFDHVTTRIILDNSTAVAGAAREARRLGYDVRARREAVTGSAREAGARIARDARSTAAAMQHLDPPVCLLYGGETTVAVRGSGTGGRNQELALAAAIEIAGESRITIASLGTDGIDGPTDAAGAAADGETVARAKRRGMTAIDALDNNDSHAFFNAAAGLIRTGPTGTNVMDVQVALIAPPVPGPAV